MGSASWRVTCLSSQPQAYLQQAQDLVILESIILQTLGKFFKAGGLPHESQSQECSTQLGGDVQLSGQEPGQQTLLSPHAAPVFLLSSAFPGVTRIYFNPQRNPSVEAWLVSFFFPPQQVLFCSDTGWRLT